MLNLSRAPVCAAVLAMLAGSMASARADVRLAGIFGDHMVLQRNARANLWGTASPGELIRVRPSWYENDAAVTAGPDGKFLVSLTTPADPGPHTIRLRGKNEITLSDVLLGEVWLGSGQSNMEMGVGFLHQGYSGVLNWEQELADADRPRIRLFTVENAAAPGPQSDVRGSWSLASAASVRPFSATAWFFAKRLEQDLDVPIGVIAADWGGTPCEAWTSAKALAPFPQFAKALAQCAEFAGDPRTAEAVRTTSQGVYGRLLAKQDPLSATHAEAPGFDDSRWTAVKVPGLFSGDLASFDGIVWMRREVEIPAAWAKHELELSLGPIDDDERTWFNGELLGATDGWEVERNYTVPATLVNQGRATIAVRVLDTGGEAGFRGEVGTLVLKLAGSSEKLSLAGSWRMLRGAALAQLPPKPASFEINAYTPSALFNGMIAPLVQLELAGALWYQGESNVHRSEEYAKLFPAMILDWRAHFAAELPFLYVQIAPFNYGGDNTEAGDLRAAQAAALMLPKTGMAVTIDLGDLNDIHPKNKQDVGRRLARIALSQVYGRTDDIRPAPIALSATRAGARVTIRFSHPEFVECGASTYELAGENGRFHPATGLEVDGEAITIETSEVSEPLQVRYGWRVDALPSRWTPGVDPIAPFRLDVP